MASHTARLAVFGVLLTAPAAFGQIFPWKYVQPWTPPWTSHESRVRACPQPSPLNRIALDDWICGQSGPVIRYVWWGTLNTPAQRFRPYYIAVRRHLPGSCVPDMSAAGLLFQACITPDHARYVGTDCFQRRVFRMSGVTPAAIPPFIQQQGQHYWLQVSEADEESAQVNVENFRWSPHRPIMNCPAVQFSPAIGIIQPLLDQCDNIEEDLAFGLARKDISGVIQPPGGVPVPPILQLDLRSPNGEVREQLSVEPDENGNFFVIPDSPDGVYIAELHGGGMLPARRTIQIVDGQCARVSFFDVFLGDLDNNRAIDLGDLAIMLSNFGRMALP